MKNRMKYAILAGKAHILPKYKYALISEGDKIIQVPASQLKKGDKVFYEKEHLKINLEDVHNDLMSDPDLPRYRAAHKLIYSDRKVPFFCYSLWENLHMSKKNAEAEDYICACERIKEILDNDPATDISKMAIRQWLTGDIILPRDKKILTALGEAFNDSELKYAGQYFGSNSPDFYNYYVTARRIIMAYVAKLKKGQSMQICERESKTPAGLFHFGQEIDKVLENRIDEISSQYLTVHVTDVKETQESKRKGKIPHHRLKLDRGVLLFNNEEIDIVKKGLKDSGKDFITLNDLIKKRNSLTSILKERYREGIETYYKTEEAKKRCEQDKAFEAVFEEGIDSRAEEDFAAFFLYGFDRQKYEESQKGLLKINFNEIKKSPFALLKAFREAEHIAIKEFSEIYDSLSHEFKNKFSKGEYLIKVCGGIMLEQYDLFGTKDKVEDSFTNEEIVKNAMENFDLILSQPETKEIIEINKKLPLFLARYSTFHMNLKAQGIYRWLDKEAKRYGIKSEQ